jgi:hypothetical protein
MEDAVFKLRVFVNRLVRDELAKSNNTALRNRILALDGRQWKHTSLLRAAFKLTSRISSSDPFNIAVGGSLRSPFKAVTEFCVISASRISVWSSRDAVCSLRYFRRRDMR